MAFTSSPLQYPLTSYPHATPSPRKRRKIDNHPSREPLLSIDQNVSKLYHEPTKVAGFVDDDGSSDEDRPSALPQANCRHLQSEIVGGLAPQRDDDIKRASDEESMVLEQGQSDTTNSLEKLLPIGNDHRSLSSTPIERPHTGRAICRAKTCSGKDFLITSRKASSKQFYGDIVASRSKVQANRAQRDFYGIDIHNLIDAGNANLKMAAANKSAEGLQETSVTSQKAITSQDPAAAHRKPTRVNLWTEKYRARKFTDLLGDERTHRSVLHWLKGWDSIVFPHVAKPKVRVSTADGEQQEERQQRKILMLTGPPGLGKTTLAHVCAKQAGYETQEINASDDRSAGVVRGRIRDMVGTENVRTIDGSNKARQAGRPVCVVVDEVDGVVGGNSANGGEGGFIKALVDLLSLDQRNTPKAGTAATTSTKAAQRKKKGENFRILRPMILICNDAYHPSLRLLRHSPHAEVIHVRRPPIGMVVPRLSSIFEKEGVSCDSDGVRTLCEATWGVTSKKAGGGGSAGGGGTMEGDVRGILVVAEWVAGRLKATGTSDGTCERLTRRWIEANVLGELAHGGGGARSLGRGGSWEAVERVFSHNAGFPVGSKAGTTSSRGKHHTKDPLAPGTITNPAKQAALERLRECVQASGEEERIMTDCFSTYPSRPYADTTTLTKPALAADWLYFQSLISHRIHTSQDWDLSPYLSYPILAFHTLFASATPHQQHAQSTLYADSSVKNNPSTTTTSTNTAAPHHDRQSVTPHAASSILTTNLSTLTQLHALLSPSLKRTYPSPAHSPLTSELLPYTLRILNPAVKPILVQNVASVRRAEERTRVDVAVQALCALGLRLDRGKVDAFTPFAGESANEETRSNLPSTATRDTQSGGFLYRLEPPIDEIASFPSLEVPSSSTATSTTSASSRPTTTTTTTTEKDHKTHLLNGGDAGRARYALRHILAQSLEREIKLRDAAARVRRAGGASHDDDGGHHSQSANAGSAAGGRGGTEIGGEEAALGGAAASNDDTNKASKIKRDFFGRVIAAPLLSSNVNESAVGGPDRDDDDHERGRERSRGVDNGKAKAKAKAAGKGNVWCTYHEGFSNAVRKPITMVELLGGL